MTPTKAKDGKSNTIDGESAVEDALAATGASKLYREITDANADTLRTRAEQMLWIGARPPGALEGRRGAGDQQRPLAMAAAEGPGRAAQARDRHRRTGATTTTATSKRGRSRRAKTSVKAVTRLRERCDRRGDDRTDRPQRRSEGRRSTTPQTADVSASSPVVPDVIVRTATRRFSGSWPSIPTASCRPASREVDEHADPDPPAEGGHGQAHGRPDVKPRGDNPLEPRRHERQGGQVHTRARSISPARGRRRSTPTPRTPASRSRRTSRSARRPAARRRSTRRSRRPSRRKMKLATTSKRSSCSGPARRPRRRSATASSVTVGQGRQERDHPLRARARHCRARRSKRSSAPRAPPSATSPPTPRSASANSSSPRAPT